MPERHSPSFERAVYASDSGVLRRVSQCQNGILPRSNTINKSRNTSTASECLNARTAFSLVRTRKNMRAYLVSHSAVSMPERHSPSFERGWWVRFR